VSPSVLEKAAAQDIAAVRVYGSSEAPFSTATGSDGPATGDDGAAMPGVEVSVRAPDDELLIRCPHQFHGYLNPAQNEGAFSEGWVLTGDVAKVVRGRIRIVGRLKEVVIRKGMKISLSEIDSAAASLGECAAFSRPDEITGERLALAIRSAGDDEDVSYASVVAKLANNGLAKRKLPEEIVIWRGPLPRTASGKVNRRKLAEESSNHHSFYAPRLRG
jgi:acyl-CoA synthetase (AMP-forming)/AMP-acid ligase II